MLGSVTVITIAPVLVGFNASLATGLPWPTSAVKCALHCIYSPADQAAGLALE